MHPTCSVHNKIVTVATLNSLLLGFPHKPVDNSCSSPRQGIMLAIPIANLWQNLEEFDQLLIGNMNTVWTGVATHQSNGLTDIKSGGGREFSHPKLIGN